MVWETHNEKNTLHRLCRLPHHSCSASLGNPGIFDSDDFIDAEEQILKASQRHQVKAGYHLVEPNAKQIPILLNKGYDMIAFSVDIRMLDLSARLPFAK